MAKRRNRKRTRTDPTVDRPGKTTATHQASKSRHTPAKALFGTAIIVNLVKQSHTREKDRAILECIKESALAGNNNPTSTRETRDYWTAAAILAAYNLGRENFNLTEGPKLKIPQNPKTKLH